MFKSLLSVAFLFASIAFPAECQQFKDTAIPSDTEKTFTMSARKSQKRHDGTFIMPVIADSNYSGNLQISHNQMVSMTGHMNALVDTTASLSDRMMFIEPGTRSSPKDLSDKLRKVEIVRVRNGSVLLLEDKDGNLLSTLMLIGKQEY